MKKSSCPPHRGTNPFFFPVFATLLLLGLVTASQGQSLSFTFTGPVTVPDNSCSNGYADAGETLTLPVAGVGLLNAQNARLDSVRVNITHTWVSDLNIWLEAPTGEVLELATALGGSGDNYTNTNFRDGALTFITGGTSPFTGSFKPEGRNNVLQNAPSNTNPEGTYTITNTFTGVNANGNWNLRLCDAVGGDIPTVQNWSLHFTILCSGVPDDAGVIAASLPPYYCPGAVPIGAALHNFGTNTLTTVTVNWSVDNVLQTPVVLNSPLLACGLGNDTTISLGNVAVAAGNTYAVKIWTSNPNGGPDGKTSNDTLALLLKAGLSGTYTIGGANPSYPTFNAALSDLVEYGVCGPVVFNVRNGTYNEQLAIPAIAGAGATNTITFQSESGDSTAVTLQYSATTAAMNYVVQLSGGDWFRFRKMTFKALNANFGRIVHFTGGSDNNTFENNRLLGIGTANTSSDRALVYSAAETTDHGTVIQNNYFKDGSDGVWLNGSAADFETGTIVKNNRFENQYRRTINLAWQTAPVIEGNVVTTSTTYGSYYAVVAYFCDGAQRITGNTFTLNYALGAVVVENCTGTASERGLVANNFIQVGGSLQADGLYFLNAVYQNAYHNSIHINSSNTNSRPFSLVGGANIRLFNNIGYNSTGGLVIWRNSTTHIEASDYNDFFTTGATLAFNASGNVFYADLAAWQAGTGFDANALSVDPQFAGTTDLHAQNLQLDGAGTPLPEVTTDIDGEARDATTPDIGADEFMQAGLDAATLAFVGLTPPLPAGATPVSLRIKNAGTATLTSLQIYLKLNNAAPGLTNWSGSLAGGDSVTVSLGTVNLNAGQAYLLTAWTAQPNGAADENTANDTLRLESSGLVAYYSFCGCTADDNSGLGNDAVIVGAPPCVTGKRATGVLLNQAGGGNNGCGQAGGQYVQLPSLGAIWEDGISVCAWVRFDNTTSYERIFDFGNGRGDLGGMPIWFGRVGTSNDLRFQSWISSNSAINESTGTLTATNAIVNGVYQYYCATITGDTMRIYVNGQLVAQKQGHPIANVFRTDNFLGHSNWCAFDPDMRAAVDEVRVYNRALKLAEIDALYQQAPSFAEYDKTICVGESVQLEARGGTAYQWTPTAGLSNPNIANPVATPANTTTYSCQITLPDGCVHTDSLRIDVSPGALNGVYTIGGASPSYATFTAAVNALATNGVCGPVVFKVRNGAYNEQLTIQAITGADAFNTVTFESESGDSTQVTLTFSSASSTTPWTVRLLGARYVTFKKMTIAAAGATNAQAVHLGEGAQNNRLLNNVLRSVVTTSTSTSRAVVYGAVGDIRNNLFRKNRIENGSTGIHLLGTGSVYLANNAVDSNTFVNQYHRGIYFDYVEDSKLRANSFSSNSGYGFYESLIVLRSRDSLLVADNRMVGLPANGDGIILQFITSTPLAPTTVSNNFIVQSGTTGRQGMYCLNGTYVNFLHNTVRVLSTNTNGVFYIQSSTNVVVQNNIFAHQGGGYAFNRTGGGSYISNYNDLYTSGANLGIWDGVVAQNIAAWRNVTGGQDQNSVSVNPQFATSSAYLPHAIELNGSALPTPLVPRDIEGQLRSAATPDIGADEFVPDSLDASVVQFIGLTPPVTAGQTPIRVSFKNNGANTLTSATLYLKVNNDPPTSLNWTGALPGGASVEVPLDTIGLQAGLTYNLLAWSALPNGGADLYPANDTAKALNLTPALNGVYTIGGVAPDFVNFTAATNALNLAGVSGPVTFLVRNGTYNEQITIGQIVGAGPANPVVFRSESGDSTLVTLAFSASSSAAPWTLRLNGADYCTFRKMTIDALGASFAQAVQLLGDAQNNRFENCVLRSTATTSTSSNRAVIFCNTGNNGNFTLKNNRIVNGSTGLWFEGNTNGGLNIAGIAVDSNQFVNQYARGAYLSNVKSAKIRANRVSSTSINTGFYGLYIINSLDSTQVTANILLNLSANAYGLYLLNMNGTAPAPVLVANNFVEITGGAQVRQAIFVSSGNFVNILHNTARVLNTNIDSRALELSSVNNAAVRNNILANSGGGYAIWRGGGGTTVSNYNNLYASGTRLGNWQGVAVATLADWRNLSGNLDLNSTDANPWFTAPGQYQPHAVELNGTALPEPSVPRDLDGVLRSVGAPDIGAVEFAPDSLDARAVAFTGLVSPLPPGPTAIRVRIKNNGLKTLTSAQVYLKVNNDAPTQTAWSGTLNPGDSTTVELGSVNLTGVLPYTLTAWTALPNGAPDQFVLNDTARLNNLYPALNGVYTIGGTTPDFPTFTAAVNALINGGVTGPVTFNARNGTYAEQLNIPAIVGVDGSKPVVFQSESGDSTQVNLQFSANSTNNFTVQLNGADWFTFRKMSLRALNTSSGRVVSITGGADNNVFENNQFVGVTTTNTSDIYSLVFSASGTTDNGNIFRNSLFQNGSYGLLLFGTSNLYETGTVVQNNRFQNQYNRAVNLIFQDAALIDGNIITNTASAFNTYIGIILFNSANQNRITRNQVYLNIGNLAITTQACTGNASARGLIANNFIRVSGVSTAPAALFVQTSTFQDVVFNSVLQTNANTGYCAAEISSSSNIQLLNNIFANTGGGYALCVTNSASSMVLNHNNLFTTGGNLAYNINAAYPNLAAWQTATNWDLNSRSVNPKFVSASDLHASDVELNNAGTPFAGVTTDIDGQTRNAVTPDIGADEFTPATVDAGIVGLGTPVAPFPAGPQIIQAQLKNQGADALTSVQIDWTLNGVLQTPILWTGNLAGGATQPVALPAVTFTAGQSTSLRVWTTNPNTVPDAVPANDTAAVLNLYPGLGGIYTIGGAAPDFPNFGQAVSALQNGGVVAAVTFNTRNGTYAEQLTLNPILGASAARTITFQSESGDSTAVTLQFSANSTNNFTVRLNGADWIRFRKMTLQALNTTNGIVLDITGGADDNVVENCRLLGVATTSTTTTRSIVFSSGIRDNRNIFRNNHFINGSYGLYYYGVSSTANYETGTAIINNRFENQTLRAIDMAYQSTPAVERNTFSSTSNAYSEAMLLSSCNNGVRVLANKINLNRTIGIHLSACSATAGARGLIANNFVQIGGTSIAAGLRFNSCNYQNVYFNSIHINSTAATSTAIELLSGNNLRLFNNIAYNSTGGYVLQRSTTGGLEASNYNNFLSTGANLVNNTYNATFFTTLTAWRNATGFDVNSLSVDPQFVSATDLHTVNVLLDGKALPFASEVSADIDGQVRNVTAPDIGADEFSSSPNEAGILSVDYPKKAFGAGTQTVQVTLVNNGLDTLESVEVAWTLNGVPQPPYLWTGALKSGVALSGVAIGNAQFEVNTPYEIRAWTRQPNGQPDGDMSNDTASVNNLWAALGGDYTIGGLNPDFPTFAAAVNALNKGGVVDSVFFNVRNGTYTEQITLKEVFDAGPDKTITFQSESGDSMAVTLTFSATSTNNFTVRLDSADYVRFRRLTLEATNNTYGRVIDLQGNPEYITLQHCVLKGVGNTASNAATELVYAAGARNNFNTFTGNRFENGRIGINVQGQSSPPPAGLAVRNNRFNNQTFSAVYLQYAANPQITGNTIVSVGGFGNYRGIYLNQCQNSYGISNNKLDIEYQYGIYLDNSDSPAGSEGLIANNFISVGTASSSTVYGIYAQYSDRIRVYHNSINVRSAFDNGRALYNIGNSVTDIKNNILACPLGAVPIELTDAVNAGSNYNDLYTTGANVGRLQGTFHATLPDWQAASGQDANSRAINPLFISDTDLHVEESVLNNAGTPLAAVTTDIDGEPRNLLAPDIGADEFAPMSLHDVGVEVLLEPNKSTRFPAGLRPVKVVLKNNGIDTVMTMSVQWRVNNLPKTPYNWAGMLYPGARDTVEIGTHNFAVGVAHTLVAYTQNPDGFPDTNPANDTARVSDLYAALNGTYTLGGVVPNFAGFSAAATALKKGGVLGPVTFLVRNGTYTESATLVFDNIPGASAANSVVFRSESGDSSLVILTRGSFGIVVRLINADFMEFRQMTFRNPINGTFFWLENGVNDLRIANSRFTTATSSGTYIYGSSGSNSIESNIWIRNNRFEGGSQAINLQGAGTTQLESGAVIENNVFENSYNNAVVLAYQNAPRIVGNTFLNANRPIECSYCDNGMLVTRNTISVDAVSNTLYAIDLYYCDGVTGNRGLVANNFVRVGGAQYVAGLRLVNCTFQNIYYNSIHIDGSNTAGRALSAEGGSNNLVQNNIFANSGGGYASVVNSAGNVAASNFNDLYASGAQLASWGGANAANLQALRTLSGQEQNSVSANPLFYSAADLHVLQVALDSAAIPVPEVTTDIDGQPRNAGYPDIGADEFDYRTDDLGVTALLSPKDQCELGAAAPVKVVIQNFGGLPQTGFDVVYRRGYGAYVVGNVGSRVVQPGDTIHYTFAQTTNVSAYKAHMFTLFTNLGDDLNRPNDTLIAWATNYQTPAAVSNMLPANGAVDVAPPVSFSWLPSAGATRYDIYIWKADQAQPTTPAGVDLTQISYYDNSGNWVYGAAYNWQVVAKNDFCQTPGPIQQFTLRQLPDLTAGNVSAPAQPFSGTSIAVSWTTTNGGVGATGMSTWFDYVYLSTDAVFQSDLDVYLGGASNLTALNPGQSYARSASVVLPQGIQGNYFLIVITDNGKQLAESNENNNTATAFPIVINLTPPPDLKVTSIIAPNNAFSGQPISITWFVKNQGSGDVPPDENFRDYVYLSASPTLNLGAATLLGTVNSAPIDAGITQTRILNTTLPAAVFGTYFIHVYTDRLNEVFEFAFEDNNVTSSDTLTIFLTPPPDLVVASVTAPAFVNNNQAVTLQWTVENQGATAANGSWTDQVFISRAGVYHPDSVSHLGSFGNPGNLPAGETNLRTGTVTIPTNIGGPHYFYVTTDASNAVFEYLNENNNTRRSTAATAVLNADLIVPQVSAPDTAGSGASLPVQWTVKNVGVGSLLNITREDRIYLSPTVALNLNTATLLGSQSYGGALLGGQETGRQGVVTLPNGISGKFYLHVLTDAGNAVYETPNEGNNSNFDSVFVNLSPWPDLEVAPLGALPGALTAGQTLPFSYTVLNTGTAPVSGGTAWKDRIYISTSPAFNAGNATLLADLDRQQLLAVNGAYTQTPTLTLPLAAAGTYYLHVVADATNTLYEYTDEGNNVQSSTAFTLITPDPVDFQLLWVSSLPDTLNSGQSINLQWSVRNIGNGTAVFDYPLWYDGVYLSTDSIWDEYDDIFVKDFTKNGPVNTQETYGNNQNFLIPNGLSGNYYVFLAVDHNERTNDENIANHVRLVRPVSFPNGPAKPVHIRLTPSPDLVPMSFVAPPLAVSGQPVRVIWTVKNNGPGATPANWTDKVYLSTDFAVGGNDPIIGTKNQNRVLAPGQSYTDSMEVFVPINAQGNFVLIFGTDANNALYEFNGENNNFFFSFLTAELPAPSDLVVSGITFPSMAMVGELFSVTWTIKNEGANPASGVLRDLIYFSADSVLDVTDIPLTSPINRGIGLAPGASAPLTFAGKTPGLPLGDYHIIVATDVLNNIFESNEGNNARISPGKVTVTVPLLPIGVLTPDTLLNLIPLYYRIEVPDSLAGETLLLTLNALADGGVNELFLSHEAVPTRSVHDFAFSAPFSPDQSILVPELKPGVYYLLAYGSTATPGANGLQAVTLKAEIINFSILAVNANSGGNTGTVTLRIDGSKFAPNMTLKLKGPSLTTITATQLYYINSTRVFATFNLAGAPLGLYDVEASKQAETALLNDGFTVVAGDAGTTSSGDGSGGFFCSIVNIGTDQNLSENIVHPASVRINRLVPITIQYGNAGNVDIPVPARFLISLRGAPLGFSPDELDQNKQELYMEFREIGGPPGILRPGSFSSITIYTYSSHPMSFILRE